MRWLYLLLFSLSFAPLTQEARTGVITGRVVTEDGSGLPGVTVTLTPVAADRRAISGRPQNRTFTDEDGNFKFTGLAPVVYSVNASGVKGYVPAPFRSVSGSGVDIRYRGDRGHAVSGSISFSGEPIASSVSIMIALTNTVTGVVRSDADRFSERFAIYAVTDGEYEITGRWILPSNEEIIASAPRRIVVKGADVGGIELKLLPMASIAGKFALEATPGVCESKRKWSLEEALLAIRTVTKLGEATPARSKTVVNGLTEKGEFTVYYIAADRYFLEPRLPNENWYVKAITAPASTSAPANTSGAARGALTADISRNGITLK